MSTEGSRKAPDSGSAVEGKFAMQRSISLRVASLMIMTSCASWPRLTTTRQYCGHWWRIACPRLRRTARRVCLRCLPLPERYKWPWQLQRARGLSWPRAGPCSIELVRVWCHSRDHIRAFTPYRRRPIAQNRQNRYCKPQPRGSSADRLGGIQRFKTNTSFAAPGGR